VIRFLPPAPTRSTFTPKHLRLTERGGGGARDTFLQRLVNISVTCWGPAQVQVRSSLAEPSRTEGQRAGSQLHRWPSLSGKALTWQPAAEAGRSKSSQRRAHQGQNQLPWTRTVPTWTTPGLKVTPLPDRTKKSPTGGKKSKHRRRSRLTNSFQVLEAPADPPVSTCLWTINRLTADARIGLIRT